MQSSVDTSNPLPTESRFLCLQIYALWCGSVHPGAADDALLACLQELLDKFGLASCTFLFNQERLYDIKVCTLLCNAQYKLQAYSMHALISAVLRCVPAYALLHSSKCGTVEHLRQAFPKAGFPSSPPAVCYLVCNNVLRICLTGSCLIKLTCAVACLS